MLVALQPIRIFKRGRKSLNDKEKMEIDDGREETLEIKYTVRDWIIERRNWWQLERIRMGQWNIGGWVRENERNWMWNWLPKYIKKRLKDCEWVQCLSTSPLRETGVTARKEISVEGVRRERRKSAIWEEMERRESMGKEENRIWMASPYAKTDEWANRERERVINLEEILYSTEG